MSGVDIGPKIGVEGEREFKDALKSINSQVKASASEIKALSSAYGKNDTSVQNLTRQQKALRDGLDASKQKVKTLTAEYDRQKDKLRDLETALNKARSENGESSDAALKAETAYMRQATAVNNLETQLNTAKGQVGDMTRQLQDNISKLETAESKAQKYGDAMKKAGDKLGKIGGGASKAGTKLTLGVTTPIVTVGTAATKLASNAETSFKKVETIADTTVKSMDEIRAGVMDASNTTGAAVTDFNEALYQTISATGDTENAIDYTVTAVKAAKGGFTDAATAVDGLTTIMNSYGLKGTEAMESVADQMLMAQNYGKTTFGELAAGMGQVVPIAAQMNIGTDTLLATMATLTKNGIGTNQAVTGLKAALSNVIKPSTEASEAAQVLGLDFSAAALQSKGLVGFMEDVKAALENASPEYAKLSDQLAVTKGKMADLEAAGKSNTNEYKELVQESKNLTGQMDAIAGATDSPISGFSTLFGSVEGLNSMLVLTSETGSKDMEGAMAAMKDSAGATQEAFDKMNSTPAAQMEIELNKLKNTGIETGQKLLPIITKLVHSAGDILDRYNDLDGAQKENILRLGATAAAAGPVLKIAGTATSGIGKIVTGLGKVVKTLGSTGLAIGAVTTVIGVAAAALYDFNTKSRRETLETVEKSRDGFHELAASMQEAQEQTDKNMAAADTEADRLSDLWQELQTLVDENGKVLDSNKDRVNYINGELNDALGTQLSLEGDVITNYQEQADAIDNLIKKKEAQLKLEGYEPKYQAALTAQQEGIEKQVELEGKIAEKQAEVDKARAEMEKEIANGDTKVSAWHSGVYYQRKEELRMLENQLSENQGLIDKANQDIQNMEDAQIALENGDYSGVEDSLNRVTLAYTAAAGASKESLGQQAKEMSSYYKVLKKSLENGSEDVTQEMVDQAKEQAEKATIEFKKAGGKAGIGYLVGFDSATGEPLYETIDGMSQRLTGATEMTTEDLKNVMTSFGIDTSNSMIAALHSQSPNVQQTVIGLLSKISEGAYLTQPEMEEVLSGFGISASEELIDTLANAQPDIFSEAVLLLYQLQSATDSEKPKILEQLSLLGIDLDTSLGQGIESGGSAPVEKSRQLHSKINAEVSKPVDSPTMDSIHMEESARAAAERARDAMQSYMDANPVSMIIHTVANFQRGLEAGANVGLSVLPMYAHGGITAGPTIAGEAGPEAVIPLNPAYRTEAVELLDQTARMLNEDMAGYAKAAGYTIGGWRSTAPAATGASRTENKIEKGAIVINIHTPSQDPEAIAQKVDEHLYREMRRKERGHGW